MGSEEKVFYFDLFDNLTDVVVAIKESANINKDDALSALDGFVDEENEN